MNKHKLETQHHVLRIGVADYNTGSVPINCHFLNGDVWYGMLRVAGNSQDPKEGLDTATYVAERIVDNWIKENF